MSYAAPVKDMLFVMKELADLERISALPGFEDAGVKGRVLAGAAYGVKSPVRTLSPLFFVEASLATGGVLPLPTEHVERAVYVVEG